jgi:hypothetical protein
VLKSKESHFSTIPQKMITRDSTMVLGMQCQTLFNTEVVCSYTYTEFSRGKYSVGNTDGQRKYWFKSQGDHFLKKKKVFSFFLWRPYSLQKDYQEAKE